MHLAQVNVAIARYAMDDKRFAGFVDNLDRINALADGFPGFVWRYVSDDEDAEAKSVFANDALIFNMSLWKSGEELKCFVYESDHLGILRQRGDWFVPQNRPVMALWWQPAGILPSITQAKHRLDCLEQRGPTEEAFTFRSMFAATIEKEAV